MAVERLQKYLASCGIASRRKAEELIARGDVKVNGRVARIGDKVDTNKDIVHVAGRRLDVQRQNVYLMLNKPRGVVTTMSDEMGRRCVAELVSDIDTRVYPVGRLDKDSEGLLIMTNDGRLSNALMHPSTHVPKTYRVTVRAKVTEDMLVTLSTGVVIEGKKTLPASVRVLVEEPERTVLEFVLKEGKNRQIRKMLEAVGIAEIAKLKRIKIGPLVLGNLKYGAYRQLTKEEVNALKRVAGLIKK
ncbi:MAG TPA: rRNA pseudouridine synthase [Clostridiales bacterium]|nr:rRNA pseudouridine synthase [Clostridiales bacterium]